MTRLSLSHTIRGRLLLLAIGVEILMLTILVSNSLRLLHDAMTSQARSQAEQYYPVLEAALTAPLAQRDFATVQAVIDESRTAGGVDYIVIDDRSGKRVGSSGWPADRPLPEPSRELPLFETRKDPRYDVTVPIVMHDQPLGVLHFGLNLSQIVAARRALLIQGVSIAAAEIVLSSLIILLIGYWLTRPMMSLTHASLLVAGGNLSPPPMPEGKDDVGQLGVAFNTMSRAISERVAELTASKEAAEASELAKSQSEERLKLALAGADLGMWDWVLTTGSVSYSPRWASMLGYEADELEPDLNTWTRLVHPDDMPHVQAELKRHLSGETPMYESEHRCLSKSGEWRWILDRGRVVEWAADGSPLRAAGTHLDITARKQAEFKLQENQLQLQHLNEQLEQRVTEEVRKNREKDALLLHQDKMASIGQLAAGVAHEINNPMAFIANNLWVLKGYVESLNRFYSLYQTLAGKVDSDEAQRMMKEATRDLDIGFILEDIGPLVAESSEGADRVKRIIHDLKDFARADENTFDLVDLNDCVRSTINIVRNEIKYVAELELSLGDIPKIHGSYHQISQVIINLLVNAAHSISSNGTITVTTASGNGQALLSIADTGHGMSDEVRKRVFEPFFTTKDVGKGIGLGLSISYSIIKKHGGEITVRSCVGSGTTFTVALPGCSVQEALA